MSPVAKYWNGAAWEALTGGQATIPIEAWHDFGAAGNPVLNGTSVGGGFPTPGFRKTPNGYVELRGYVNGSSSTLTTLPVGYRPPAGVNCPCFYWSGATWASARLEVGADGTIKSFKQDDVLAALNYLMLDVVRFPTDQTTFPLGAGGGGGGSGGTGAPEVHVSATEPSPRAEQTIWIDTDEAVSATGIPFASSLPPAPIDGQEVYLVLDAALGLVQHLRYRAAGPRWDYLGGSHPTPTWTALPTLQAGLTPYTFTPEYTKDALGYVQCRGEIQAAGAVAGDALIWTFPTGFRPVKRAYFPLYENSVTYRYGYASPDGTVRAAVGLAGASVTNLNGVRFPTL